MFAEKTVLLPVSTDEAFALITEPDRLRRWKTVSARVDLRAGGQYRWTVIPGHVAAGTFVEVEPGRRIVFGCAGKAARPRPGRFDSHRHPRTRRGRHLGPPCASRSD